MTIPISLSFNYCFNSRHWTAYSTFPCGCVGGILPVLCVQTPPAPSTNLFFLWPSSPMLRATISFWLFRLKHLVSSLIASSSSHYTFTAGLCTTAEIWKQPKCSLINEKFLKYDAHIHTCTLKYYPTLIKDILKLVTTWMNMEDIKWNKADTKKKNTAWSHLFIHDI